MGITGRPSGWRVGLKNAFSAQRASIRQVVLQSVQRVSKAHIKPVQAAALPVRPWVLFFVKLAHIL